MAPRISHTGADRQFLTIQVGTLELTYLEGRTGPAQLKIVRIDRFTQLARILAVHNLVRQLRAMRGAADVLPLLYSVGLDPADVAELAPRNFGLTLYQVVPEQGLVEAQRVLVRPFELLAVTLTHTFMVEVRPNGRA